MADDGRQNVPIGLWLKRADELIGLRSNEALQEFGLTRLHWQALNTIREAGRITREALLERLRDFADASQLDGILADFEAKRWTAQTVDRGGKRLGLTPGGEAAHAAALERQNQVRRRLANGLSEADYTTLVTLLQKIVANLE